MPLTTAYHRPPSLEEALALLAEPNRLALAGGTVVNADRARTGGAGMEVVDLQALDLAGVEAGGDGTVRVGATTTLAALAADPALPAWLAAIATAEAPSTLRTLATVGGTIATRSWESLLLAAFLVCDGTVEAAVAGSAGPERIEIPLAQVVADGLAPGTVVTAVTLAVDGSGASATTSRTPADTPIVGAVARVPAAAGTTRLALTGVAATPVLVAAPDPDTNPDPDSNTNPDSNPDPNPNPDEPAAGLDPPADFRGSSPYRRHLAQTLSTRARANAQAEATARGGTP